MRLGPSLWLDFGSMLDSLGYRHATVVILLIVEVMMIL